MEVLIIFGIVSLVMLGIFFLVRALRRATDYETLYNHYYESRRSEPTTWTLDSSNTTRYVPPTVTAPRLDSGTPSSSDSSGFSGGDTGGGGSSSDW